MTSLDYLMESKILLMGMMPNRSPDFKAPSIEAGNGCQITMIEVGIAICERLDVLINQGRMAELGITLQDLADTAPPKAEGG